MYIYIAIDFPYFISSTSIVHQYPGGEFMARLTVKM